MAIPGKSGQTTREKLVNSLFNQIKRAPGTTGISGYFQQAAIQSKDLNAIFGTPEEFLQRYADFQKAYEKALQTNISITAGSGLNIDAVKKSSTINLRLLNYKAQQELHEQFMNEVLRLPDLLREAGLPAYELPSGNKYRNIFKYMLAPEGKIEHPALIFLNKTIFSYDENKTGLPSFTIPKSGLMSYQSMNALYNQFKKSGSISNIFGQKAGETLNILTLDVETTGVFDSSQVRSMSLLQMTRGPSGTTIGGINQNIAFKNPQMAGMTVSTMNEGIVDMYTHLAKAEGIDPEQLKDMGPGGKTFLDETADFIERIVDPSIDRLAGHNIPFDLDKLRQTAVAQSAYSSHTRIQQAFKQLDARIAKGDFLVDTLESTRAYLLEKVQQLVDQQGLTNLDDKTKAFINALYSQETLATIHTGGAAPYVGVENIALNTNLFELLEQDQKASKLYDLINKGSHIAETDVHLQSYIADYVQSGRLDLLDRTATMSIEARRARSRIFQSAAITPTTNIADVQLLHDTVFSHITKNESIKNMGISARVTAQSLGLQTAEEGTLKYSDKTKQFIFSSATGEMQVDEGKAITEMQRILQSARAGSQDDKLRILSTGVTFQQSSNINEILNNRSAIIQAAHTQPRNMESVTNAFSAIYKNLGSRISDADYIKAITGQNIVGSPFEAGLGSGFMGSAADIFKLTGGMARDFAAIGDPFAALPMRQRVYSTVLAEATAPIARTMQIIDVAGGGTPVRLASTQVPDLVATLGQPVFEKQIGASILSAGTEARQKIVVPTEILNQAIRDSQGENFTMRSVGRSVLEDNTFPQSRLNAVWMISRDLEKNEAKKIVRNIFELMKTEESAARVIGVSRTQLDETVKTQIGLMQGVRGKSMVGARNMVSAQQAVLESIMENGIVFAHAGEQSEQAILAAKQAGEVLDNDVLLNKQTMQYTVPSKGYQYTAVPFSPLMDREELEIAGMLDEFDTASELDEIVVGLDESGQEQIAKIPKYLKAKEDISSEILKEPDQARILRGRLNRAKIGKDANVILDLFNQYKPKIGLAALGLAAISGGYYISKKHRERQLYDESIEAQPIERASQVDQYNSYSSSFNNNTSYRRDPLVTAGVIGNLDRAKIGHTRMGSDRYNHLFGGGY